MVKYLRRQPLSAAPLTFSQEAGLEQSDWAFWIALIVMLIGLAGTILPAVPGIGLIWIAALVYAIVERFATIDPLTFAVLTLLAAVGIGSDLLLSHAGSKLAGASWQALAAGFALGAAAFVLALIFGGIGALPAAIIGTVTGIVLIEFRRQRSWREALKAGGGWLVGCLASRAVQFVIALMMIAIFVWQAAF
jgi:uncharacterized protein YqgC (DUF456 family)